MSAPASTARYVVIPLARHGFIPRDPITNPVAWHIEDTTTGQLLTTVGFREVADADAMAARLNADGA